MPTVVSLLNGKLIMAYEYSSDPAISGSHQFPVYYKTATNPEKFAPASGVALRASNGTVPNGSPYVVWSSAGGANGTSVVSCGTRGEIFVNKGFGEGPWRRVAAREGTSYTRHLRVLRDESKLLIMGAGKLPPSSTNRVTVTVMDIPGV
ncbi:glycoside hydrolase family 93 protein [Sporormia fimetaria CBS 119925]|uniref:Glycoside hydrolase family 93 protein n=1 Tax=Sporormia fimetaria CBS 119925 TaxID=1340428 RepID=A0A6A6VFN5_9PLEO|nr:glycoside hydrolase family 93 protein [Sporormia fimetaria CBS 119925]